MSVTGPTTNAAGKAAEQFSLIRQKHETSCAKLRVQIATHRAQIALLEEKIVEHEYAVSEAFSRVLQASVSPAPGEPTTTEAPRLVTR